MARTESRTKTAIWSDPAFLALTESAQRMYWMLYSQPTINLCGIQALTVNRWATKASDSAPEMILAALADLQQAGFIAVDADTEEVWVRSFVRHDGVINSPKTRLAALAQVDSIFSEKLRDLARDALSGPPPTDPSEPRDTPSDTPSTEPEYPISETRIPHSENGDTPSDTPSDTPRVRAHADSVSSLLSPSPISCLRPPGVSPEGGTGATHRDRGLSGMKELAQRVANVCAGDNRLAVQREAAEVVTWAHAAVDLRLVDEAIGWAASQETPPVLPRALAAVVLRKARDSNIPLHPFKPSQRKSA